MVMVALTGVAFLGLTIGTEAGLPSGASCRVGMGVGGVYVWVNNKAKKRLKP
jgi:tight adherence protein B